MYEFLDLFNEHGGMNLSADSYFTSEDDVDPRVHEATKSNLHSIPADSDASLIYYLGEFFPDNGTAYSRFLKEL